MIQIGKYQTSFGHNFSEFLAVYNDKCQTKEGSQLEQYTALHTKKEKPDITTSYLIP